MKVRIVLVVYSSRKILQGCIFHIQVLKLMVWWARRDRLDHWDHQVRRDHRARMDLRARLDRKGR